MRCVSAFLTGANFQGADRTARLSEEPDANLNLMPDDPARPRSSVMSIFSFAESYSNPRHNPYDMSCYIDRVGLKLQNRKESS